MPKKKKTAKAAKKASKAGKKSSSDMDWLVKFMKANPKAEYADAAAAAKKAGKKIYQIMWGRAGVLTGRFEARPRGQGKARMAKKTGRTRTAPKQTQARRSAAARPSAPSAGGIVIDASDVGEWQSLIDAVNTGSRLTLSYDGTAWRITTG